MVGLQILCCMSAPSGAAYCLYLEIDSFRLPSRELILGNVAEPFGALSCPLNLVIGVPRKARTQYSTSYSTSFLFHLRSEYWVPAGVYPTKTMGMTNWDPHAK